MPFNVDIAANRQALPKPEILSHPLDTPVIESVVIRAAGVTADVSGPYTGRRYLVAGTLLSKREDGTYDQFKGTGFKAPVNEVQEIKVDATGGNITIKVDGEITANISATATHAEVQAALELLSNVNPGDIVVSGGPGGAEGKTPYVLTFGGQYEGENVPQVIVAGVSLTGGAGTVTASTKTAGSTEEAGSQNIAGILFDTIEFADATAGSNEPAPMVCQDLKLDENKIVGFSELETEISEWAAENNNKFFDVSNAQEE